MFVQMPCQGSPVGIVRGLRYSIRATQKIWSPIGIVVGIVGGVIKRSSPSRQLLNSSELLLLERVLIILNAMSTTWRIAGGVVSATSWLVIERGQHIIVSIGYPTIAHTRLRGGFHRHDGAVWNLSPHVRLRGHEFHTVGCGVASDNLAQQMRVFQADKALFAAICHSNKFA